MNRWQVPALLLVVFGMVVAGQAVASTHGGATEYSLYVAGSGDPGPDAPDDAVLAYGNLSERGQQLFDRALADADNASVVYGEGSAPPDFEYRGDHLSMGHGYYFVEKSGTYYQVYATYDRWGFFDALGVAVPVLIGAAFAGVGAWAYRRENAVAPAVVVAVVATLVVLNAAGAFHWFADVWRTASVVGGACLVVGAAAWLAISRLQRGESG
ncbi:hypothetical protein [Halocalculus aciditolerans]|uniref:DUF7979 domain-containing protein n=1 Tax=Halocalculus aciditolerans TaxID=1383812 RepID=A0A830FFW0_9EURY|nr:hypothetical protein [Halocalculus aciditolerans]GGL51293.1 hypothetical protein GCM10009039_06970 [Halocalculus aciditolerans]